ncbi:MAG: hypothetical protein WC763_06950, partial [Candidatus Paceibacterota bacterium]
PIASAIEAIGLVSVTLDGELYNHEFRDRFEELSSFIRDSEARDGSEQVQYHVYDLVDTTLEYEERLCWLERNLSSTRSSIVCVQTELVDSEEDLMATRDEFLEQGYEGAMARNATGKYLNARSYDLLKIKLFDDAEYEVIGVNEGRGKLAGHAIFTCKTDSGVNFDVKMKGLTSTLKAYFDDPSLVIGRMLTVKYQGITKKSGVPRFPVGLRFRDD